MDQGLAPQEASRRRTTRSILVVGDSRSSCHTLSHQLGNLGYLLVLSDSGAQALELISARSFDLVLLDMDIPGLSGTNVLQEIRGGRGTLDLPVIVLTASDDPASAVQALAAGADDHLAKPFAFEELAARLDRALARSGRIEALKRSNLALDARITTRAIELGETRSELAAVRAELARLRAA